VRHPVALTVALSSFLLSSCVCALALDPSLDISQYAHTAWKVRDGFAKGRIGSIAQTPDGYLWLATEFGLLRFDGVRTVSWQPSGEAQLPSNNIRDLLVARDGTLWIGTLKGLASYKDGKLTQYPELAGALLGWFLEDREQTVWFGARQEAIVKLCAIRHGKVECYGAGSFGTFVNPLYEDHNGNLWASSQNVVWRWAPGTPERYELPRGITHVIAAAEDNSGGLLLGTDRGLKQLVSGKIQDYPLPGVTGHFTAYKFLRGRDGSLWIGTTQGLLHLHKGTVDRFSAFDGLSGDLVDTIFEDREGSIWVATPAGIDRFRDYAIPTISRNQGLSDSATFAVQASPDGNIWIGTEEGLNRWANRHMTVYRGRSPLGQGRRADESKLNVRAATEATNSGLVGGPKGLGLDHAGRLWASTIDGVFYFERDRFARVPGVHGGNIFSIAGDGRGGVWILEVENLFHWSPSGTVEQIPWPQFGQRTGRAMLPDREGGLWLGFYEGDVVYVKDGKIVRAYGSGVGLGDGRVNHLRFGPNGGLWASTENGLSRIRDERVATLTSKNGLPCDEVHWSMEDEDHALWLYMPCGLVRIARSELDAWINDPKYVLKTTVFDNSDGVRNVGLYGAIGPHVTKASDGRIWFVPYDGVSVIDPHHLPVNKLPPPVHVEQIIADGKTYDASNGLQLPPHVRDLTIDYTALSLVAPEKIHFRYKLEGQDPDWREVVNDREVQYSNLAPRHYTFRVMACNNSGVWDEAGATLAFVIPPAWYQTNWFRAACAMAFLAMFWGMYELRVRQLAAQFNMRLEERVNERTRIARELHDTLLQNFQGLLPRLQAALNLYMQPERVTEARKTLEAAIDTASEAITEGRDAVKGLRLSTVEKNDLAVAVRTLGEELAAVTDNHSSPTFEVAVEGTPRSLHPILRDEVYRLVAEALRNAFRHAQAGKIEVEIRYGEKEFRLQVRDNGRGIDPSVLSGDGREGHYGLHGMHERAKIAGGKLRVWSELDSGTEVELSIPGLRAYTQPPRRLRILQKLSSKDKDRQEKV
jgi:signal transduction histidine kinase/ligand-binding sensor domain-containing protein